jgi:hypothetical protein
MMSPACSFRSLLAFLLLSWALGGSPLLGLASAPEAQRPAQLQANSGLSPRILRQGLLPQEAKDNVPAQGKATGDLVVFDQIPPRIDRVQLSQGVPEITLSEEPDLTTTDAILIDGSPVTWTLDDSRYALRATAPLAPGAHILTIGTGLRDLAGNPLAQAYSTSFTLGDRASLALFAIPDPRQTSRSTIGSWTRANITWST